MYIAMKLARELDDTEGRTIKVVVEKYRLAGVLLVFETKTAAREVVGDDVELMEVTFAEPAKASAC